MKNSGDAVVVLDNIRSSHNVGSIFRTSDALGIKKIYLAGYTPPPKDKFGRENKEIAKVALGAENSIGWEVVDETSNLIRKIKKTGYSVVAVEQDELAIDYKKFTCSRPTAFIFGNEVEGLPKEILKLCDKIVSIPMKGDKESLNVSVAFGIALSRILDL